MASVVPSGREIVLVIRNWETRAEIVMRSHRNHEADVRRVLRAGGGDERQAASKADAEHAYLLTSVGGKAAGGVTDEINGIAVDLIIGEGRQFGRQNANSTGGHGAREGAQSRLVDTKMMHSMHDDHRRRVGDALRNVKPRADRAGGCGNLGQLLFDGISAEAGERAPVLRILDSQQKRNGAKMRRSWASEEQEN